MMKFTPLILMLLLVAGCVHDDARLQGTWRSNRNATVAAAPEKAYRFRDMFGLMTVTYSNNVITTRYEEKVDSFGYRVVSRGSDYSIIHYDSGLDAGKDIRIHFVDSGAAYWVSGGVISLGIEEKFDKVAPNDTPPNKSRWSQR
jgi:hypothetical protein